MILLIKLLTGVDSLQHMSLSNNSCINASTLSNISKYIESEFDMQDGWYAKVIVSYHNSPITLSIQWIDNAYYVSSENAIQNWGQFDLTFLQNYEIDFSKINYHFFV